MIRELAAAEALDAAADNPEALPALLSTLVDETGGLFSSAVLFKGGYAGDSFVTVTERGMSSLRSRLWLRWPLRRLFTRMKPARIRNVFEKDLLALAIPFSDGKERYVVVAPLSSSESSAVEE